MAERNLRNKTVSAPEKYVIEGQLHDLSELDQVDAGVEIPYKLCAIAFLKFSTRQEMKISRNMKEILLDIISRFEVEVATAMETVNCNIKTQNNKLTNNIISSFTSALTKIS